MYELSYEHWNNIFAELSDIRKIKLLNCVGVYDVDPYQEISLFKMPLYGCDGTVMECIGIMYTANNGCNGYFNFKLEDFALALSIIE